MIKSGKYYIEKGIDLEDNCNYLPIVKVVSVDGRYVEFRHLKSPRMDDNCFHLGSVQSNTKKNFNKRYEVMLNG